MAYRCFYLLFAICHLLFAKENLMTIAPTTTLPARRDVPKEHTWNAESVYANNEAYEADFASLNALVEQFMAYQGHLGEGPAVLAEALAAFEMLLNRATKVYFYGSM